MRDNSKFLNGLNKLGIVLEEYQLKQFEQYYDLLIEWNSFMNLTAITEYEDVINKHFLDSLSLVKILPQLNQKETYYILDMGTGAGFPGIPLKIAFPNLEFLLMDSLNKRIQFLNAVIDQLQLKKIMAVHGRAEEAARKKEYREQFDYCVSRAVAKMVSLSEFCIPFVKIGGAFIPYKSGKAKEEISEAEFALKRLGGKIITEESFVLPETDMERTLVFIQKVASTPSSYPRGGGKPLKTPILKK